MRVCVALQEFACADKNSLIGFPCIISSSFSSSCLPRPPSKPNTRFECTLWHCAAATVLLPELNAEYFALLLEVLVPLLPLPLQFALLFFLIALLECLQFPVGGLDLLVELVDVAVQLVFALLGADRQLLTLLLDLAVLAAKVVL